MRYQLKRSNNVMIFSGVFAAIGVVLVLFFDDTSKTDGMFFAISGVAGLIYSLLMNIRKLTFDTNSFYIGRKRYSYSDIERVESWRETIKNKAGKGSTVHVKIIVDGKTVYRFNHTDINVDKFVEQLTLHGVKHNLYDYIEIGKNWR